MRFVFVSALIFLAVTAHPLRGFSQGAKGAAIDADQATLGEAVSPPNRRAAQIMELVFQIKTATDSAAPKASYGSCFVVDEVQGLLVTNYHVVAFALNYPQRYHLYLLDGDQPLPAEVVAFDAVNDLALVRVPRTFKKRVRFARGLPESGDKIYSIGWPADLNKSMSEGNFNGLMAAGPYKRIQMSIPLNPGMSGGPTINQAGEVVGVNVSLRSDSQSLAFAVPNSLVDALLSKPRASYSRPSDAPAFDEEVRSQLDQVQESLSVSLLKARPVVIHFGDWQAEKPKGIVKCWREQDNGPKELTTTTTETCYLPSSSGVRRDVDTGTFRLKYTEVSGPSLTSWQYVHALNEMISSQGLQLVEAHEKFATDPKCHEMDLTNSHKVPLRVHYCVNAYVRYAELYGLEFEAVTLAPGKSSLLLAATFLGFSSRNASEILRQLINGIKREE